MFENLILAVTTATELGLNKTNCQYPATPAIEVTIPHIYASVKLHVTVKTNSPQQIKRLRCTNIGLGFFGDVEMFYK